MSVGKMHADEVATDVALVRRLLEAQFPQWAGLPIAPCPSSGTDNAIYRLGESLAVRLPRIGWAVGQVEKEHRWLPRLAPHLPLAIPVPLAVGKPAEGYPWHWGVYPWLAGVNATWDHLADPCQAAEDLAGFVVALRQVDAAGGPPPGEHNSRRGEPLAARDASARAGIASSTGCTTAPPSGPPGRRPWPRLPGAGSPSGSTGTCSQATCWPWRGASAP